MHTPSPACLSVRVVPLHMYHSTRTLCVSLAIFSSACTVESTRTSTLFRFLLKERKRFMVREGVRFEQYSS